MEEEKAAAYYDELTRKGEGAARFKQGLGFSSSTANDNVPKPGSALASSSSFLSKFVKASSAASDSEKKAQTQSIHDKLNKKPSSDSRVSGRERDGGRTRRRSRSRERYSESRRRSRSRERHRYRDSEGDRGRRRSRSFSPRKQRRSESDARHRTKVTDTRKGKDAGIDYSNLIRGYDRMSSAERVKAKMKLQLSETAAQDSEKGTGWERFEFNKHAPLDDEEVEVAEDDASLVKHIGQSFRFSAVEARREKQIQAAHEEAMFGGATAPVPPICTDSEPEMESKEADKKELVTSLLSETVLAKQKGSWRDRVRQA